MKQFIKEVNMFELLLLGIGFAVGWIVAIELLGRKQ
jgi:hypothetical protein